MIKFTSQKNLGYYSMKSHKTYLEHFNVKVLSKDK